MIRGLSEFISLLNPYGIFTVHRIGKGAEFNFTEVMKVVKQDICCKYYFDEIKKNSQGRIQDSYLGQIDQNQS